MAKAVARAKVLGYSSVDEFVCHVLEHELDRPLNEKWANETLDKLKGLGYFG